MYRIRMRPPSTKTDEDPTSHIAEATDRVDAFDSVIRTWITTHVDRVVT